MTLDRSLLQQAVLGQPDPGMEDRLGLRRRREAVARSFMEWSLGRQDDLRERFADILAPVLWITGRNDEKYSRLAGEAVSGFPGARHVAVEGAGHRVPWQAPDRFAEEVRAFLR